MFLEYADTEKVSPIDAFVRMLLADSMKLRGAALKAVDAALREKFRAEQALRNDPMWNLECIGISKTAA
ncbi:MAG: hypothetical protein Q8Q75_09380 [Rhodoferax sp.]|uniref:hypothetical protein n=1 Tax=Rhodoferax sp. TaxID=50421 RepID=UPI0027326323|nr:hypothetical protein [Rhodoferax sp.]MDP3864913.1 hypothetical protein [Rhodoferax sp.]